MNIFINRDLEVRLADVKSEFKQFWKQICLFGEYVNPNGGEKMVLDEDFAKEIVENFESGKYGVVAVPLGHPKNDVELAELNRGEVKELKITDEGIDALIEIRDEETVEKIENRLIPDVSMGFSEDYLDKKTGQRVGALLKHVGLVVDPYIKGMNQFVACGESSASMLFSDKEINNEGEGMKFVKIKNEREFDVEVKFELDGEEKIKLVKAGEEIEVPEGQVESVKKQFEEAEAPKKDEKSDSSDGNEELSDDSGDSGEDSDENDGEVVDREKDVAKREAEIARRESEVAWREREVARKEAEKKFNALLSENKVIPVQKEAFLALSEATSEEIHLSDEITKTPAELILEFCEKMPNMRYLSEDGETGSNGGESDEVEITDEDKKIINKFGLSEEDYKEVKKENL